jgi:nucleotide-binding universal stress UspA family protein
VLAAIALEDGDNRHDDLNNLIISHARRLCRITEAELHVVAALKDRLDIANLLGFTMGEDDGKLSNEQLINARFGIKPEKIHLASGPAKQVIVEVAEQTATQLLVIGTIARAGISGAVLGNTCEKVLDQSPIDILTIN